MVRLVLHEISNANLVFFKMIFKVTPSFVRKKRVTVPKGRYYNINNNVCKYEFNSVLCIYCSDACKWHHGTCFKPKPQKVFNSGKIVLISTRRCLTEENIT